MPRAANNFITSKEFTRRVLVGIESYFEQHPEKLEMLGKYIDSGGKIFFSYPPSPVGAFNEAAARADFAELQQERKAARKR